MKVSDISETQRNAAKVAGCSYLFVNAAFAFAEFAVNARLIVFDDPARTVVNILAHEQLFRLGIAADLLTFVADVVILTALYVILRPVSESLALLAAFWRVVSASILVVATLNSFNVLELLTADPSRAFEPNRLQALAMLSITAHGDASAAGLLFIAFGSGIFSYLWLRSRYIPWALAGWGMFASFLGVIYALVSIIFPEFPEAAGLALLVVAASFEITLGLWLLIKGLVTRSQAG
ncbi:MAG: DUF4386 domain-containing protein [Acidobacteriaceae bacterium]